jgi:hypothetical protein
VSHWSVSELAIYHQPILPGDIHVYRLESSLKSGPFWNGWGDGAFAPWQQGVRHTPNCPGRLLGLPAGLDDLTV